VGELGGEVDPAGGLALKLTMLSANSLLLPMVVRTLSGWSMVVANRPISRTVPVMPPPLMKSPTLKGRRMIRKAPAAKLASRPLQAAPMAMPAAASRAAKLVVSMPNTDRMTITSTMRMMTRRVAST
jgi:hypothetical protein